MVPRLSRRVPKNGGALSRATCQAGSTRLLPRPKTKKQVEDQAEESGDPGKDQDSPRRLRLRRATRHCLVSQEP